MGIERLCEHALTRVIRVLLLIPRSRGMTAAECVNDDRDARETEKPEDDVFTMTKNKHRDIGLCLPHNKDQGKQRK